MKTRILSACIMLPLLLFVYFGGKPLALAVLVISLLAVHEFYGCLAHTGRKPCYAIGYGAAFALGLLGFFMKELGPEKTAGLFSAWCFLVVAASLLYLFKIDERDPQDAFVTVFGVFYAVFLPFHVVLVDQSSAPVLVWLIFLTAFGSDIFAYFTGVAIGKHKLCPGISPKKTVEGAVGGLLGGMILSGVFAGLFAPQWLTPCVIIGLFAAAFSQLGDLSASVIKRKAGIKDYGKLIPGHGGILDRFDSVLFTAPLIYYCILLFF